MKLSRIRLIQPIEVEIGKGIKNDHIASDTVKFEIIGNIVHIFSHKEILTPLTNLVSADKIQDTTMHRPSADDFPKISIGEQHEPQREVLNALRAAQAQTANETYFNSRSKKK